VVTGASSVTGDAACTLDCGGFNRKFTTARDAGQIISHNKIDRRRRIVDEIVHRLLIRRMSDKPQRIRKTR
jgi:hypothetical protein